MNFKEEKEHARLLKLWATGKATMPQMLRCMELDRKAKAAHLIDRLEEIGHELDKLKQAAISDLQGAKPE